MLQDLMILLICVFFFFFLLGILIFPGSSTEIYSDHFSVDRENPDLRLYSNFGMEIRLYKTITFKDNKYIYRERETFTLQI